MPVLGMVAVNIKLRVGGMEFLRTTQRNERDVLYEKGFWWLGELSEPASFVKLGWGRWG